MISSIDSIPTPLFQGSLHSRDHKSKTPGPLRSFYVQALASLTPASRRERGKRQGRRGHESRAPWRRPRCQQRRDQAAGPDRASPAPPSPGNRVRDVSRPPDPGGAGARSWRPTCVPGVGTSPRRRVLGVRRGLAPELLLEGSSPAGQSSCQDLRASYLPKYCPKTLALVSNFSGPV